MPLIPQPLAWPDKFARLRPQIHQHPELGFENARTSHLVATYLNEV